jgi:septin family protein
VITLFAQIRAELQQHAIKLYPFDTEELDEEEVRLNERLRVNNLSAP